MESPVQSERQVEELAGTLHYPDLPIISTGHANIYRGVWASPEGTQFEVAIKELRTPIPKSRGIDLEALTRRTDIRMKRELLAWSQVSHRNLHPLLGYRSMPRPRFISPWCPHGNLTDYLRSHPGLTRLDKLRLVYQVGCALNHLHSQTPPLCHANIMPENVLVNDACEASLSGLGSSRMLKDFGESDGLTTSEMVKGTLNYMAGELFIEEQAKPGLETDVYAFGGFILAVMSGNPPYFKLRALNIMLQATQYQPPQPEDHPDLPSADPLWILIRRCWSPTPSARPTMREVLGELDGYTDSILSGSATSPDDDIGHLVTITSPEAVRVNGRFSDIFEGIHKTMGRVALKRPRIGGTGDEKDIIRRFEREGATWRRFDHPHILKFLGTFKSEKDIFCVSPFIRNGTLLEHVKGHPEVNRVKLLCETADAIHYLHQNKVVHGDIKASNILISDEYRVLLCDFGLTKVLHSTTSTAMKGAGTIRWQSPELWDNAPKTFNSDVYAFSMTIVEVITGAPPFSHLTNDMAILMAVYSRQERPKKTPTEFNGVSYENAWAVAEACWETKPGDRIPISEAFSRLREDPSLV